MSFDTFTIAGILSAILCGGFLIALALRNEDGESERKPLISAVHEGVESN